MGVDIFFRCKTNIEPEMLGKTVENTSKTNMTGWKIPFSIGNTSTYCSWWIFPLGGGSLVILRESSIPRGHVTFVFFKKAMKYLQITSHTP